MDVVVFREAGGVLLVVERDLLLATVDRYVFEWYGSHWPLPSPHIIQRYVVILMCIKLQFTFICGLYFKLKYLRTQRVESDQGGRNPSTCHSIHNRTQGASSEFYAFAFIIAQCSPIKTCTLTGRN